VEVRRELADRGAVTLVGETGLPRWHRWALGAPELSAAADQTCQFEAVHHALLELLADPGVERYRVTADVRLLWGRAAPGEDGRLRPEGSPYTQVGPYFGYAAPVVGGRAPAAFAIAATFNDALAPEVRALAARRPDLAGAAVRVESNLFVPDAEIGTRSAGASLAPAFRFPPADRLPGAWRRLALEVTPAGARVLWAAHPGEAMRQLADLPAETINAAYEEMRRQLDTLVPGTGVPTPTWSPRMPFGIWCRCGAVSVRNVRVEVLN
jgi:serine/threonine-protein kinase